MEVLDVILFFALICVLIICLVVILHQVCSLYLTRKRWPTLFFKEKRILKFISGANVQIMVKRPLHGFVAPNAE